MCVCRTRLHALCAETILDKKKERLRGWAHKSWPWITRQRKLRLIDEAAQVLICQVIHLRSELEEFWGGRETQKETCRRRTTLSELCLGSTDMAGGFITLEQFHSENGSIKDIQVSSYELDGCGEVWGSTVNAPYIIHVLPWRGRTLAAYFISSFLVSDVFFFS